MSTGCNIGSDRLIGSLGVLSDLGSLFAGRTEQLSRRHAHGRLSGATGYYLDLLGVRSKACLVGWYEVALRRFGQVSSWG